MPSQHGKSLNVIDLIACLIGHRPNTKVIYTSFSDRLSVRANLRPKPSQMQAFYRSRKRLFSLTCHQGGLGRSGLPKVTLTRERQGKVTRQQLDRIKGIKPILEIMDAVSGWLQNRIPWSYPSRRGLVFVPSTNRWFEVIAAAATLNPRRVIVFGMRFFAPSWGCMPLSRAILCLTAALWGRWRDA